MFCEFTADSEELAVPANSCMGDRPVLAATSNAPAAESTAAAQSHAATNSEADGEAQQCIKRQDH
jgi:hypothetical protein